MLVLALDTSTPAVTAGVAALSGAEATILATRVTANARAHGELLTPHATEALQAAGIAFRDIDAIVCGVGPGPFTGLRAGIATGAALAQALDIPTYPVCGLDAIAAEVVSQQPFIVATDARRREIYWATYDAHARRMDGPHVQAPREVADRVPPGSVMAGDGARQYVDMLGGKLVEPYFPSVNGLVAAAKNDLLRTASAPLLPLYLRRPDAVEFTATKKVTVR